MYKRQVEGAGKAALTTASAALRRALSPDGVSEGNPDRVASMVGRLEEGTKSKIAEERAELDRSCTAFMMRLGREVRKLMWVVGDQMCYCKETSV